MKAVFKSSLLVSALLVLACKDDPPTPPCDITDGECQEAVFALTARVRGQEGAKMPPIRVISREQLRDEIQTDLDNSAAPSPDEVAVQQAFALLHLLPAEAGAADEALADDLAEGVAAYYSPRWKAITVISDAAENEGDGTFVLIHEFTHALQDQRGDLNTPLGFDTTDALVSFDSLVEGEAAAPFEATNWGSRAVRTYVLLPGDGTLGQAELDRRLGNDDATERDETVRQLREIALLRLREVAS